MPTSSPSLLLRLFRLQEAERQHVGRALHNQVGQALSAIKMGAHLVQSEDDAEMRAEDLREIVRASDETVALLRDLHATLHPPQLDAIGLDAALRAEIERISGPGTLTFTLTPLPRAVQADIALVAFRIGQALLRTAAHAHAITQVALHPDEDAFVLTLAGMTADLPEDALWHALAVAAGGRLDHEEGRGWRLRLPYAPAPETPPDPA